MLNKRTISSLTKHSQSLPLLLIDLDYFSHLIDLHLSHHNSKLKHLNKDNLLNILAGNSLSKNTKVAKDLMLLKIKVLGIFESVLKSVLPEKICLFSTKKSTITRYLLYLLKPFNISYIDHTDSNTHSFVYNFLQGYSETNPVCVFTNDISSWMFSDLENKYKLFFSLITKNDRCLVFNNTTCGDLVCKILNSTKPNHKLGFDVLKNISFQYIFFLILGLKFFYKNLASNKEFYLDSKYFRQIHKVAPHEKFLRASGKGLEYLHKVHKTFYFILKHNDFMSIFLYSSEEELDNYLSMNHTIQYQDKFLLLKLKQFYDKSEQLIPKPIIIPELKIVNILTEQLDYWYKDSYTLCYFCHKQTESFYKITSNPLFNSKLFHANLKKLITYYKKFPTKFRASLSKEQTTKYLTLYNKQHLNNLPNKSTNYVKQEFKLSDIPLSGDAESYVDSLIASYLG